MYNHEMNTQCHSSQHFHVIASDVFDIDNRDEIVRCETPNEALENVLSALPATWEGSIEVMDDKTRGPSEMPLIDYWRTAS